MLNVFWTVTRRQDQSWKVVDEFHRCEICTAFGDPEVLILSRAHAYGADLDLVSKSVNFGLANSPNHFRFGLSVDRGLYPIKRISVVDDVDLLDLAKEIVG